MERRYRDLFACLVQEGRTAEALAVLGLLKEEELSGLDPASIPASSPENGPDPATLAAGRARESARAAAAPPAERAERPAPKAERPDLFSGTRDEAAWLALAAAAERGASLEKERSDLEGKRSGSGLSPADGRRLEELPALIAGAKAAYEDVCARAPEILRASEPGLSPASWAGARLSERQAALSGMGRGATLVHALSEESALYLVTVTAGSVTARESAVGRDDLAAMAGKFRDMVANTSLDPKDAAKSLYDALIAPVKGDLDRAGTATLMLSLDGALRYAPMAALWDGESWLAERYPLALFTESTPARLSDPAFSGRASVRAMGVTAAWPGFPALPGVASELAAVVRSAVSPEGALEGEARLDGEFTRGTLAASLSSDAPVVHVASHFKLDPASLDNTVLLLGDGGNISLREIQSGGDLDFRGLDLLTLSACDTASGASGGEGKEVESLGEVVQRAGASAVLATLMPVDDRSAPELMREFYRLRYQEGEDKAGALRGAQLLVMRDERTHPGPPEGGGVQAPDGGREAAAQEGGREAAAQEGESTRGTALSAAGTEAPGEPRAARWEGTGFSHPFFWSTFVIMGSWK
jgi:CHAT domain-containing protein